MAAPLVSVVNLGCRVNRVESDRIVEELASAGFAVGRQDEAALIVINTCAVTGRPRPRPARPSGARSPSPASPSWW